MLLPLEPEPKRGRKPVSADDANPDSQPRSEDDSNYGSPVQFRSMADVIDDGPDSARDTSDESARRRDKRPMSDVSSPSQPAAKRARDHTAAPEYIITVGNVNRRTKLENRLPDVFVTEEEDDMQDAYIRENGRKLAWLAKQPDCVGMGRREAFALVYPMRW